MSNVRVVSCGHNSGEQREGDVAENLFRRELGREHHMGFSNAVDSNGQQKCCEGVYEG